VHGEKVGEKGGRVTACDGGAGGRRDGTGPLTLSMHATRAWLWDGKSDAVTERGRAQ